MSEREALPEGMMLARELHLLNTTIIPSAAIDGLYEVRTLTLGQAKTLVYGALDAAYHGEGGMYSHVGHESTALLMSTCLGTDIAMDRSPWEGSGTALAFQVNSRPPEGRILTIEEIEARGFTWRSVCRVQP